MGHARLVPSSKGAKDNVTCSVGRIGSPRTALRRISGLQLAPRQQHPGAGRSPRSLACASCRPQTPRMRRCRQLQAGGGQRSTVRERRSQLSTTPIRTGKCHNEAPGGSKGAGGCQAGQQGHSVVVSRLVGRTEKCLQWIDSTPGGERGREAKKRTGHRQWARVIKCRTICIKISSSSQEWIATPKATCSARAPLAKF